MSAWSGFVDAARRVHRGTATVANEPWLCQTGWRALTGGRNNAAYAFERDGEALCLKFYRVDDRQRAGREWQALTLLQNHGHAVAPRPIYFEDDAALPAVVMEFVPGHHLGGQCLSAAELDALADAMQVLHALTPNRVAETLPPVVGSAGYMLDTLTRPDVPLAGEAEAVRQAWLQSDDAALLREPVPAVFSGDDPQPANCLWNGTSLRLIDFEYSGWSDRAWDLALLVEHVQSRGTPDETWEGFIDRFELSDAERRRLAASRRLMAVFWMLLLRTASSGSADMDGQRFAEQVSRAQRLCRRVSVDRERSACNEDGFHVIEPERGTLHGQFSREFAPAVTIDSGDTVRFRTLDAGWTVDPAIPPGQPGRKFEPRDPARDNGHALCGPIGVRGAEPGMTLEVQIGTIVPSAWGWTACGGWDSPFNRRMGVAEGPEHALRWTLDAETMKGRNQQGHEVMLRPFMGVLGMPPDAPGTHSTTPPRPTGGNMDCKELVAGSSLFLPIAIPGGLFSVGDGHALQGDGEVSGTAIECPMEQVDLTFILHPDRQLTTPRAHTPAGWLTLGFHEDLEEAMYTALEAILDLMQTQYGLERRDAVGLASLLVDLRITQIVNGVRGVHAFLPHGAVKRPEA